MTYCLNIISIDKQIFSGLVKKTQVITTEGELGIYPRHSPLVAVVKPGVIRITKKNDCEECFYISGGILEVCPDNVVVLTDCISYNQDLDKD